MKKIVIIFITLTILLGCKKEMLLELKDQSKELNTFLGTLSAYPGQKDENTIYRIDKSINDPKYFVYIKNIKFCQEDFFERYPKWELTIYRIEKIDDYTVYTFLIEGVFSPVAIYFYNNITNKFDLCYVEPRM